MGVSYEDIKALRENEGLGWVEIAKRVGSHKEQVRAAYNRGKARETGDPAAALKDALRVERTRMIDTRDRTEDRWVLRTKVLTESLVDAALSVIPKVEPAKIVPLPSPRMDAKPQTALLVLSDLHVGAHVDPAETGGLGEYDYSIFKRRLNNLRDAVRSITAHHRQSHPVPRLVAPLLGDLIENVTIFPAQGQMVDLDLMAQVFSCVEDLAEFYVSLLDTFDHIFVPSVSGNHGRIGFKGQFKHHINWDYLIPKVLAYKLERYADRITIQVPKSPFVVVDIEGFTFLMRHGHGIKSWGGIPWYGVARSTGRWTAIQAARSTFFDVMLMGHFHQHTTIPYTGGEVIVNGSFVGTTEYSVEVMESLAEPSQFFAMVHPDYCLAARYPILLDRAHRRRLLAA